VEKSKEEMRYESCVLIDKMKWEELWMEEEKKGRTGFVFIIPPINPTNFFNIFIFDSRFYFILFFVVLFLPLGIPSAQQIPSFSHRFL